MARTSKFKFFLLALLTALQLQPGLQSATVKEMDREAQAYFNKREYNQAIGLWLSCLEMEPDNEKIQQKVEQVYEIKQRKDLAYQRAKLNYRISRKKLVSENDPELEKGISMGRDAINGYMTAYRLDPNDSEMKDALDNVKKLDIEIRAAQERLRLSRAMREKIEQLKTDARAEMALEFPDYEKARKIWREILRYVPQDIEAIEGKRKCDYAIENRIKFHIHKPYLIHYERFFRIHIHQSLYQQFINNSHIVSHRTSKLQAIW